MQSMANFSNVGIPGRFIFRIDEWIQPAGCLDVEFERESKIKKIQSMIYRRKVNFFYKSQKSFKYGQEAETC